VFQAVEKHALRLTAGKVAAINQDLRLVPAIRDAARGPVAKVDLR
jgi:hypothetical protein